MNKKILIGSIIAVVLLTLVSFSSVVGYSSVKNTQEEIITSDYDFEYCKDYLFETLVEIADNEDVKDLINSNNQNLFPTNFNQGTLFPFRRNTNKLSIEHLDLLYKMGSMIIDRLGEDKVAEIMEKTSIEKPEFADEIDTIIMGNDELKERIYTLSEMNEEQEILEWNFPVICTILLVLALPFGLIYLILFKMHEFCLYSPFLIFLLLWFPIALTLDIYSVLLEIIFSRWYFLYDIFNCIYPN